MAKHDHMSTPDALTHAALVGHLLRGTVIEGKPFEEAVADAHRAVGPEGQRFQRHQVRGGPSIDEAHYPSWAR